jgi:hypothetical protein
MMTAEELEKALGARLAKSRLAYRRGLLAEFCNWWAWRMRADGRPRGAVRCVALIALPVRAGLQPVGRGDEHLRPRVQGRVRVDDGL